MAASISTAISALAEECGRENPAAVVFDVIIDAVYQALLGHPGHLGPKPVASQADIWAVLIADDRFKNWGASADKNGRRLVMPIQMICPNLRCRKFLAVPDEIRGKLVKCQHCQTQFRVPAAAKKPLVTAANSPK
ncbi:MAG TPA: hypothetical protein VFE47_13365 [Tepidisphaeraceae bacterium]|jgi:hypothetical protein|nr:hypothetical protein [Tepidisphaeraceae bacterium]